MNLHFNNFIAMSGFIKLYNGDRIPTIGLGTGKIVDHEKIQRTIDEALALGYRHFDTATNYKNELSIGTVLKKAIDNGKISRQELFLVTKLPLIGMHTNRVKHFVDLSLRNLQTDYIDLYLIHWPVGLTYVDDTELMPRNKDGELLLDMDTNLEEIWKVMESQVNAGKIKSIGLSNFNQAQIQRILDVCEIPPAVLQVEVHASFQQKNLLEFCFENGIVVCGYAPLGSPGRRNYINANTLKIPKLLEDPVVNQIANFHEKSPAQVLLRYLIQALGICVIPKTENPRRLKENIEIFDFELQLEEIIALEKLDAGEAARSCKSFEGANLHPECPF